MLSQAQAIISRAEAATAAALTTQQQQFKTAAASSGGSLERSTSNVSNVLHNKLSVGKLPQTAAAAAADGGAKRELPALPSATDGHASSKDDLDALESVKRKISYRELSDAAAGLTTTQLRPVLPNTEEYPAHHHPGSSHRPPRGLAALPPEATAYAGAAAAAGRPNWGSSHSSTLLPGQTYPDHSVVAAPKYPGIHTLQEVFYHREMRLASQAAQQSTSSLKDQKQPPPPPPPPKKAAAAAAAAGGGGGESPPPPLYPKQYHQVVEQRRRSGLDRPTATAVPPPASSHSPVVDRKIKPETSNSTNVYRAPTETSKPFEMSDFYKYSTKFRKASQSSLQGVSGGGGVNGDQTNGDFDSSPRSSTASGGSSSGGSTGSGIPPELPHKGQQGSPAKAPPPPPPKSEKLSSSTSNLAGINNNAGNNNNQVKQQSKDSLVDSFSSEMLDWYNKKSTSSATIASSVDSKANNNDNSKPATLV